jgi:hypothetical protein
VIRVDNTFPYQQLQGAGFRPGLVSPGRSRSWPGRKPVPSAEIVAIDVRVRERESGDKARRIFASLPGPRRGGPLPDSCSATFSALIQFHCARHKSESRSHRGGGARGDRRRAPDCTVFERYPGLTLDDADRISVRLCELRTARGERVVGRRIGFTIRVRYYGARPPAAPASTAPVFRWGRSLVRSILRKLNLISVHRDKCVSPSDPSARWDHCRGS